MPSLSILSQSLPTEPRSLKFSASVSATEQAMGELNASDFEPEVILSAVPGYVSYPISDRQLEALRVRPESCSRIAELS